MAFKGLKSQVKILKMIQYLVFLIRAEVALKIEPKKVVKKTFNIMFLSKYFAVDIFVPNDSFA